MEIVLDLISWVLLTAGGVFVLIGGIVEHVEQGDIVITADIPLAARCLEKNARVLGPTGRAFTQDNIGDTLATRNLLSDLRESGQITGGPAPFKAADRSRFLQELHEMIGAIRRAGV